MKKILSLVLVVILSVSLMGCSSGNSKSANSDSNEWKPEHDITIRVPFAAGGSADTFARIYGQGLQKELDTTVLVTNVTGANGAIAAADLNSYDPDPCEMMVSGISLFTLSPLFNPDIKVNLDDYDIVNALVAEEFILVTAPGNTEVTNWEELVEYSKSNRVLCASNPPGGTTHMLATALFNEAGLEAEEVPTKGANKSLIALVAGDVNTAIVPESQAKQFIEEGTVAPILAFSKEDYTGYEGITVPNAKNKGYDIVFKSCNFILARKGVDKKAIDSIYDAYLKFQETDEFKQLAKDANYTPDNENGEEVREVIENSAKLCQDVYEKYYK